MGIPQLAGDDTAKAEASHGVKGCSSSLHKCDYHEKEGWPDGEAGGPLRPPAEPKGVENDQILYPVQVLETGFQLRC
jgi:hypothetical protein